MRDILMLKALKWRRARPPAGKTGFPNTILGFTIV